MVVERYSIRTPRFIAMPRAFITTSSSMTSSPAFHAATSSVGRPRARASLSSLAWNALSPCLDFDKSKPEIGFACVRKAFQNAAHLTTTYLPDEALNMISQTSPLARLVETDSGIGESYRHITKSVTPGELLELSEATITGRSPVDLKGDLRL